MADVATEDMELIVEDPAPSLEENGVPRIGTRWRRYQPWIVPDRFTTGLLSISGIPAYETKSHEELRYEDLLLDQDRENAVERLRPWQPSDSTSHRAVITRQSLYSTVFIGDPDALNSSNTLHDGQLSSDAGFLISISAMTEHADQSVEELRYRDHNSLATWQVGMQSTKYSYKLAPIELLVRRSVGEIVNLGVELLPRQELKEPLARIEYLNAAKDEWCVALLSQSYDALDVGGYGMFLAVLVSQIHDMCDRSGDDYGPPVSLDWINRDKIIGAAPWGTEELKDADLYDVIDSFAFFAVYCAMAVVYKPLMKHELDGTSPGAGFTDACRSAIQSNWVELCGSRALELFKQLYYLETDGTIDASLDERTQAAVADALGVLEPRPPILRWLRVHAQRMEQYLEACKACAAAAVAYWDETDHADSATSCVSSMSVEFVEIVKGDTAALSDAVTEAVAYVKETATRGQDWLPRTSPHDPCVTRLVDPSISCVRTRNTRRVPFFTDLKHTEPDPYKQMSRIAFLDSVVMRDTFENERNNVGIEGWLPSELHVGANGCVKFASYINNLHPLSCKPLYASLEKVLERMLPAFERVLGGTSTSECHRELHGLGSRHRCRRSRTSRSAWASVPCRTIDRFHTTTDRCGH